MVMGHILDADLIDDFRKESGGRFIDFNIALHLIDRYFLEIS